MARRLVGAKPLSELMLKYCKLDPKEQIQWNSNRNSNIVIQENALESVVCEMASVSSRPQSVNTIEVEWYIYASVKYAIINSDNGLSHVQSQAIIWTAARWLSIRPLGASFSEVWIEIQTLQFKKCISKYRLQNGGHYISASMCQVDP